MISADKWSMVAVVQDSALEKLTNYSYTITKLSPGTTYYFSVVCQNDIGVSVIIPYMTQV